MNSPGTPQFLVIQLPDLVAAKTYFASVRPLIAQTGGTLRSASLPRDVTVLEAGTRLDAILIASWPSATALHDYWNLSAQQQAFKAVAAVPGSLAVAVQGVPDEGLPDPFLPTAANVQAPPLGTPPAYMLIQGRLVNPSALGAYVDIIMPMIRERHGYYVVYATPADVTVLHGQWSEDAFIVSRWPTLEAAREFWFCELYQDVAIPVRTGHGAFTVSLCPGIAG